MTREVMDNFEDHINILKSEWCVLREKWFFGETIDPVYEGTVRDFIAFDETMHGVYNNVQVFMKGVEQLSVGMTVLSEGVSSSLSCIARMNDSLIASDSCKLKEATNQIARADAPHSAIAKLVRDMNFNILNPVRAHIQNNRNLKVNLDIRRRRLIELNSAKKIFDEIVKRNVSQTDRRYTQAQAAFEAAKLQFTDVDRHVFEWLYILEEYRGDILDSTLQTLKYLEYEFFASSAHAISTSLPSRMEFRPMVEMTPEHLEAQVDMELQKNEESEAVAAGAPDTGIVDFSARLIDKKVKEDHQEGPALAVDPLSLSSLLQQGFEEGPARQALRKHLNNTQAALDWLINSQGEEEEKKKLVTEGVRMPTTVKRVQKLKAMRRAQAEKLKQKGEGQDKEKDDKETESSSSDKDGAEEKKEKKEKKKTDTDAKDSSASTAAAPPPQAPNLLEMPADSEVKQTTRTTNSSLIDNLLDIEEKTELPTDFSKPLDFTSLPMAVTFDHTKCEKPPLEAAVAAGVAQPRSCLEALDSLQAMPSTSTMPISSGSGPAGLTDLGHAGVPGKAPGQFPNVGNAQAPLDPFGSAGLVSVQPTTESASAGQDSFGDLVSFNSPPRPSASSGYPAN